MQLLNVETWRRRNNQHVIDSGWDWEMFGLSFCLTSRGSPKHQSLGGLMDPWHRSSEQKGVLKLLRVIGCPSFRPGGRRPRFWRHQSALLHRTGQQPTISSVLMTPVLTFCHLFLRQSHDCHRVNKPTEVLVSAAPPTGQFWTTEALQTGSLIIAVKQ